LETTPATADKGPGTAQVQAETTAAQRIATEIRGIMAARKLGSLDLANYLQVHRSTANRRINGESDLTINEIEAIAGWLDVPVTRLIAPAEGALYAQ
jgi:transcriptional regulator with XRE-family HTH domain